MLARRVAKGRQPHGRPRQARSTEQIKSLAPSISRHDRDHQRRRDRPAETREAVGDALREAALADRQPEGEGARRSRKGSAFARAHEQPEDDERCDTP